MSKLSLKILPSPAGHDGADKEEEAVGDAVVLSELEVSDADKTSVVDDMDEW
jgi:hypothetical protein